MPRKNKYTEVKQFFTKNNCKLLSTTYETNKKKLEYLCKCGHKRISCFANVKKYKQFNCKNCTINKWDFISTENMHPKTFKKMIKVIESKYKKSLKYRDRFKSNEILNCSLCKKDKKIIYFYPSNLNKKNNSQRCRFCNNKNSKKRRSNHTQDQIINYLLTSCKHNSIKREKRGRNCKFELTKKNIYDLISKQNNKCVYTDNELIWEYNHPHKVSIDRIDSNKGYNIDNIQLVIHITNQAKSDLTEKDFLQMIKQIYDNKIKNNPELKKILKKHKIQIKEKSKEDPKPVYKPKQNKKIYQCIDCKTTITKESTRCRSCASKKFNKKKVNNRPSLETLLKDLEILPYTKVGKKYGVSDNCIRKWIKGYINN